jgi:hypothetical protein
MPPGAAGGALCLESGEERAVIGFVVDRATHRVIRITGWCHGRAIGGLRPWRRRGSLITAMCGHRRRGNRHSIIDLTANGPDLTAHTPSPCSI